METKDYWIYKNKIIFKPNFNDKLDNYFNIISNYDNYNIAIETNNKYCKDYKENYKLSKFNQQIIIPANVTRLTFGSDFNKQVIIPQSVTHLAFGKNFNQQITIPENVTQLTFGFDFNQQVTIPKNVTHLTFYCDFNQQVTIPENVTHLTFGTKF